MHMKSDAQRNREARDEFQNTVCLLMNCMNQHPGDHSRLLNYAMKLVMIDRKINPRGLPPSPTGEQEQ